MTLQFELLQNLDCMRHGFACYVKSDRRVQPGFAGVMETGLRLFSVYETVDIFRHVFNVALFYRHSFILHFIMY